jgi:hypothetical protein
MTPGTVAPAALQQHANGTPATRRIDMRGQMRELQQRLGAWFASHRPQVGARDDSGAISTEMAIITAMVGAAAVGLAVFIGGNILDWQGEIPTP